MLLGPPVGGALYSRYGFHGPFILTIIATAIDLFARVLIIERKRALRYGVDPAAQSSQAESDQRQSREDMQDQGHHASQVHSSAKFDDQLNANGISPVQQTLHVSLIGVFKILLRSPRALTVTYNTLIYGYVCCRLTQ